MTEERLVRLPILRLWNRLLVSLQGDVTDALAERLGEEVLLLIHEEGADGLVLDLTGVWTMDSHLCAVLSRLAKSAALMGTPTIVSGLSSEIAQTLQTMGIELEVQSALSVEQALEKLGVRVSVEPLETAHVLFRKNPFQQTRVAWDVVANSDLDPLGAIEETER